ncbi:hypothetical protein DFH08DRAFT_506427 [Mycena albidolilacea]|uniref:HNH nuclease domain-containing protein n=1 Tax=Mycena albidolilacea TaxID=1033008 RepID=A0AAD7EWZ7_9AGAR|nr:hypothetical protein DFH08DRAFT_506427 [Mycena albidolilacea]
MLFLVQIDVPQVLDLQMISDRNSTSDTGFLNRESRVKERDGDTCVFHASIPIEVSRDCVLACHFVPHSKGDEYVKCLERFHEVPQEDQMHTVETPWNVICVKDSWRTYLTKARAAILLVPNRFLSNEDIDFTPKSRFKEDGKPYSDLPPREEESYDNSQSQPSPTHPRFQGCSATWRTRSSRTGNRRRKSSRASLGASHQWAGISTRNSPNLPKHPSTTSLSWSCNILWQGAREWALPTCGPFHTIPLHSCGREHIFPLSRCTRRTPAPCGGHSLPIRGTQT